MTRQQFRNALVDTFNEAFAYSYFDRSDFNEGSTPTLRPWSFTAERKFRDEARNLCNKLGVKLLPADPAHLKPKMRLAAE